MSSPEILRTVAALRRWRAARRGAGETVAFVPTMGNLHAGHAVLLDTARGHAECVLASIFVNPAQFGPGEDYARYPRTFDEDCKVLSAHGAAAVFAPDSAEIYPHGTNEAVTVEAPALSGILCGRFRPGHFRGVASVVARLLNLAEPDVALFGEKDYQQLLIIRRMAEELFFQVKIIGVPTVREADGLAVSSRNQYLGAEERRRAPALHRALNAAAGRLAAGAAATEVAAEGMAALEAAGFKAEYFEVRNAADLGPPEPGKACVILAAGWLGRARLIDNIRLD